MSNAKALFLDRDGVINFDYGYVYQSKNFHFIEGIFELCQYALMKGYKIIIVTNQAGIGRGYYSEEDFHCLTKWMKNEFIRRFIYITDVYYCPFHPEFGVGKYKKESKNRKPGPGMLLKAAHEHHINLEDSVIIGDNITDMMAGKASGIETAILFSQNILKKDQQHWVTKKITSLYEATNYL